MANDKDFVVNGPVVVGKDTKVTVGTVTSGAVDLSTGNYFVDSPSGDYTYSFTNPGGVQAFQIEATGGSDAVDSTFSTTLYAGNSGTQTITNGLDLSTDGGLVWLKCRNQGSQGHFLMDSARNSFGNRISSHDTSAQATDGLITSVSTGGFTLGNKSYSNNTGDTYVSWSFKKQAKFFDVVTYTGTAAVQNIAHNLGSVPGMIIVKRLDSASFNWNIYHRNSNATPEDYSLEFNTGAAQLNTNAWGSTAPTSTHFTVGASGDSNGSGAPLVAYLFAHDTASDGLIQCGSLTDGGAGINLGWKPQFVLIKRTDTDSANPSSGSRASKGNWIIADTKRGMPVDDQVDGLSPNLADAEIHDDFYIRPTSTGFTYDSLSYDGNGDFIYMAIRSPSALAITWPTSIEWTQGATPSTPAEGATDVYTFTTDDGGTTYTGIQSIDTAS